jgi:predicted regulator of Ras-like GTPase activity (Roadblock/LC7/MglB family)
LLSRYNPGRIRRVVLYASGRRRVTERSRGERLRRVLGELQSLSPDVKAGVVISGGETLASTLPEGVDSERVSAMISALFNLAGRTAREQGRDAPRNVKVRNELGYVLLSRVDGETVLAAITGTEARIGLIFYDMRNAGREISRILKEEEGEA